MGAGMFEIEYRRPTVPTRHLALRSLVRDVRRFLPLVDRLESSARETAAGRRRMLDAFLTVWASSIEDHFAATEELLIPITHDDAFEERALTEHRLLRSMAAAAYRVRSSPDPVWIANFARRLRRHLQWEQGSWFPKVERTAGSERRNALADGVRRREAVPRRADA